MDEKFPRKMIRPLIFRDGAGTYKGTAEAFSEAEREDEGQVSFFFEKILDIYRG